MAIWNKLFSMRKRRLMIMYHMKYRKQKLLPKIIKVIKTSLTAVTFSLMFSANVSAAGETLLPVEIFGNDVVSVEIPVVTKNEKSPFDFILDPQGLLYETNAMSYGGGAVEKGASLLFHNSTGAYNFSRWSDCLTVTNRSTVPVTVTVSASISNLDGIGISETDNFSGDGLPSIYLAIVDDKGNIQPLFANEETILKWTMQAAPQNTYTINEKTQTYENIVSGNYDSIQFDTYSFALTGACNPYVDWKDISCRPIVTVVWRIDPILQKQEIQPDKASDKRESMFDKILEDPGINSDNERNILQKNDLQNQDSIFEYLPKITTDNANDTAVTSTDDMANDTNKIADTDNYDANTSTDNNNTADEADSMADGNENDVTENTADN